PGWNERIDTCLSWDGLPLRAREYVQFIEAFTETTVSIISVGSDRQQTIVKESPWIRS
ncbi:MAG TPA: adenylosuccinate synthetase, partial [Spirochaetaceae bacterium]|nr:adenylosuccinate synthetase [Spirochaetaceae bacterium]